MAPSYSGVNDELVQIDGLHHNSISIGRISGTVSGFSHLTKLKVELPRKARQRLKWFDYYNSRGCNARLTCRHFDISPQTFYRWKRRYNPRHIASLEDRSHRPRHLRQPAYSMELVEASA